MALVPIITFMNSEIPNEHLRPVYASLAGE